MFCSASEIQRRCREGRLESLYASGSCHSARPLFRDIDLTNEHLREAIATGLDHGSYNDLKILILRKYIKYDCDYLIFVCIIYNI